MIKTKKKPKAFALEDLRRVSIDALAHATGGGSNEASASGALKTIG